MSPQLSRRDLLKGTVLAGAALPFARFQHVLDKWYQDEAAPRPGASDTPIVRLSHNENPFGPSEKTRKALVESIAKGNRYPRESILVLTKKLAATEGVSEDQVLVTAGSTELLGVVGLMAGMHEGKVISCHPTFSFLMYYASQLAAEWVKVPLTDDHHYDLAGINSKVDQQTKLVFICNPNNPTGTELPRTMLEPFCATLSERCPVYVDEAYIELSEHGKESSLVSLTNDHPDLIVSRTFSKIYAMAGLRVGYAIAHPETIRKLRGLMIGGNITPSATSVGAAMAALDDEEFLRYCREMNDEAKDMVYTKFNTWGIEYIPSSTNFIFFRTDRFGNTAVVKALEQKNIMLRDYADVPSWARVSMGTIDEMKTFLSATEELLV